MNKEHLQGKLDELKQNYEQTIANLHALQGAMQVIEQLIKECEDDENANNNG